MWILNNIYNGECFCLPSHTTQYTIGRQNADLLIRNDNSISRLHANLHLNCDRSNGCAGIELEDVGSTYGTFHNKGISVGKALKPRQPVKLKVNDVIRFGVQKSVWKVVEMNVITATSCLNPCQHDELRKFVEYLDGEVVQSLSDTVNYLTMSEANITMKLLQALIAQMEIVNMDFWRDFVRAVKEKRCSLPKAENYRPVLGGDVDLNCNIRRSTLFTDYTFIFLYRKHLEMYGPIVQAAGGHTRNLNANTDKSFLLRDKVVVVQYTPSTQEEENTDSINRISDYLKSHLKRLIPEYEIGLAVLHCSVEVYCNPNYDSMTESDAELSCFKNATELIPQIPQDERHVIMEDEDTRRATTAAAKMPITSTEISNFFTSQESLESMRVTETPKESFSEKRKRTNGSPALINNFLLTCEEELSEICLSSPAKKLCLNSEKAIPADEVVTLETKTVNKYNSNNFLEKTQTAALKSSTKQMDSTPLKSTSKSFNKRRRIAVLGEDDNDVDNLFDFDECNEENGTNESINEVNADYDVDSSNRASRKRQREDVEPQLQPSNLKANNVESIASESKAKAQSMYYSIPKAKDLPTKVSISGWINCSVKGIETTHPAGRVDIKAEDDTDTWEEKLKDAFIVTKMSPSALRRNTSNHTHHQCNEEGEEDDGKRTNFKKFVKRYQVNQRNPIQIEMQVRVI